MDYVALGLLALNAFQLVYWSRQTHKLVDKLMSRNYAEYVQAQNPPLPRVRLDDNLVEEHEILDELNGMVGR